MKILVPLDGSRLSDSVVSHVRRLFHGQRGACEALQRHVVRHFREGTPLENQARDYLRNIEIQEAVYRSQVEEQRIALDAFKPARSETARQA